MKRFASIAAYGATALIVMFASGCYTPEHRQEVAAGRDETRRADFERCRADGHSDCDAILNAPVNSTPPSNPPTPSGDAVRERERRLAYDRCVSDGGRDCSALLR
jgi:hypothetical protein